MKKEELRMRKPLKTTTVKFKSGTRIQRKPRDLFLFDKRFELNDWQKKRRE